MLGLVTTALVGTLLIFVAAAWFLWRESIDAEEERLAQLAQALGQRTERIIVDARGMLERFNELEVERCSAAHLDAMHAAAVDAPYVRAIGYLEAAERRCGVGFLQGIELRPDSADRIYESGVIAWWPGPQTAIAGVPLFLMRYGSHDVAIDPRTLLEAGPLEGLRAGLWVEGLRLASSPAGAELPPPESLPAGVTVDHGGDRVISRFSLGTVLPIDIVAIEPLGRFWGRYWPTLASAGGVALLLAAGWIWGLLRYMRHRQSLARELRDAIETGRIRVRYQPIIDLGSGRCVGAEALARWEREDGEIIGPETFLPIAEQAGLVPYITLAVVDAVLADLGGLLRETPQLRINVNVAPEDLASPVFGRHLAERIGAARVSPRSIKLEITERALVDSERARAQIDDFRARGHEVAIDDFGTGYSSLSYLESFSLDTLKIDKTFVDAIGQEAVTSHVIVHVIEMAKSLELDAVAEGVTNHDQVAWLLEQGVAHGQGYLFSRALSARRFLAYLRANSGHEARSIRRFWRRAGTA
ncbi:MAG: EAL domain-containing protein [Halofilum sp. (in: g-proteobacteria)]|nr:EAL domain-containing protein [Halofilum sp. (in: g-proteobacteria)]